MNILLTLRQRFAAALDGLTDDPAPYLGMIRPAGNPEFGDYQANCAMPLAGRLRRDSTEVAEEIVERLDVEDFCEAPTVAGRGFINLKLREDWLLDRFASVTADERLGVEPTAEPLNVVIDFSSPNVAKPMHVGHLRSTVIGDALQRLYRFVGHDVTSDNHIGDWGTQFGMILYGYKNFLNRDAYETEPVAELARLYRLVNQISTYLVEVEKLPTLKERREQSAAELAALEGEQGKKAKKARSQLTKAIAQLDSDIEEMIERIETVKESPELSQLANDHSNIARQAREETAKLHAGDEENNRLWSEFMPHCLAALDEMYDRLGVRFDETLGESHYHPVLGDVVDDLAEKDLATESEGAICVFKSDHSVPFMVRKSDGAFTYATSDLATIRDRVERMNADRVLYVVDARQAEHFSLLFDTARRWGYDGTDYRHVVFGSVLGPDGKPLKTRSGSSTGLGELIDEAVTRAGKIVAENDDAKPNGPELSTDERQRIAELVGIGGIKYADLKHGRESDYKFDWDKMLATTGDTGTYIQYAYARLCGIFRKADVDPTSPEVHAASVLMTDSSERALMVAVLRFPETLDAVLAEDRPNLLVASLYDLANLLTTFYGACPVLRSDVEPEVRASRLRIGATVAGMLKTGLNLLGIPVSERM